MTIELLPDDERCPALSRIHGQRCIAPTGHDGPHLAYCTPAGSVRWVRVDDEWCPTCRGPASPEHFDANPRHRGTS